MPLSDELIQQLLAPKVKAKSKPKAAPTPSLSQQWHTHFHHKHKPLLKQERQIGPLSYNFGVEKECSLLGCWQPTYYEVDGQPKCSFHALAQLAYKLTEDTDGNSTNADTSSDDWF